MKKILTIGIILLFVGMSVSSISALLDNDIEITISAGVLRNKWGNVGLGWVVKVDNNLNHNITGVCIIKYYTLSGESLHNVSRNFHLAPFSSFVYNAINIIDFHPINRFTVTVKADSKTVSGAGIEIGPWVILGRYPPKGSFSV